MLQETGLYSYHVDTCIPQQIEIVLRRAIQVLLILHTCG